MEERIIADLAASYGITCGEITPVSGGWLNRKWKVLTGKGEVLVKQFSNERFNREKLAAIEEALQRQIILHEKGVPCPAIHRTEGRAIRLLDGETAYMVMDFCPGWMEGPDTVTALQMRSLGSVCGMMHKAFSQLPVQSVKGYPLDGGKVIDGLWANFRDRMAAPPAEVPAVCRKALLAQEPILLALTPGFFDRLPKGIAHEDFAFDNLLFDADGVTAVIDFDRNQYSFIWHDIGRALLCFALKDDRIDREKVRAFLDGYNRHLPLSMADIADALRISWCIEAPWWIQPGYFQGYGGKVARFRDEILWLTAHWFEIDALLA